MPHMAKTVAIIGGGIGGLSAAIRLRTAGYAVTLYEKNARVGGKMSEFVQDGFRWDTGPSVITMRHIFADLFQSAGRKLEDYLTLLPVEPLTRYFFADGSWLDATRDLTHMAQQITAFEQRDVEGYLRYLAYAAQIHRITGPVFIYDQPPTLASFARVPIRDWLKADPLRTMNAAINAHVRSPQMRQLLGRFATYVGGSPYLAPATLNVIAYVELMGGVWYPQGGVYQIAAAMEKLAREIGVEIYTDVGIRQINLQHGTHRIAGLTLQNGTIVAADVALSNLDVTTTYRHLLPANSVPKKRLDRLSNYEPSCSGFILLLGVKKQHAQLAHHNVFFSADYAAEFDAIFKDGVPPDDPTIYVAITSKTDATHAPEACENWFVLVNAPPLSDKYDWEANKQAYRNRIQEKLAARGLDVRENLVSETILTPLDLERMTGAWRGALYGPSANKKFTAFLRPHNRSREIAGLYFAGGTTHPGGGVPMVTLSGKVAAHMIMEDYPL
jgi:phytoene desaturase